MGLRQKKPVLKLPLIKDKQALVARDDWEPKSPPRKKTKPFELSPPIIKETEKQCPQLLKGGDGAKKGQKKRVQQKPASRDDMDDFRQPLAAIEEEKNALRKAKKAPSKGDVSFNPADPKSIGRRRSVSMAQGAWAAIRDGDGNLNMFVPQKDGKRMSMISVVGLTMFRKLYAAEMAKCRLQKKDEDDHEEEEEEEHPVPTRRNSIISTMSIEAQMAMKEYEDDDFD